MAKTNGNGEKVKSMESWIWDAACSIRGAADAAKFKDYILPLIFIKRLCDVFDDEIDRIAEKVKSRTKALQLVELDKSIVRFYIPIKAKDPEKERTWDVVRKLSDKIGQKLTDILRDVAKENKDLQGIIDRIDFNATTHGQRDIDDDRLSKLIEKISEKRLGLKDVEADIIGRSYEYLIRKFAEGSGQSAGEFYTPAEVGFIIAKIMDAEPGMDINDPCCGSASLLIKCELVMKEKMALHSIEKYAPLQMYGQELIASTWAMSKMNMVIHDMEGKIEIGDTMKNPVFREGGKIKKFDREVANPMWNQDRDSLPYVNDDFFINDELERFPAGACGGKVDWGWIQHIYSSLNDTGKAGTRGERQKETEIGLVPESWEVVRIGDIFKFSSGKTRPKNTAKERTEELNIPVYGGNGILGYSNQIFLNRITLILGRVGEYCGCAHITEEKSWISDNALYAKEQIRDVDLVFIRSFFEFLNLNQYSNKMGQPLITQGIINDVKFGFPSIKEQVEIAHYISSIDNKIENLSNKKQTLIALFKTLLHELMTGQRRVHELEFNEDLTL